MQRLASRFTLRLRWPKKVAALSIKPKTSSHNNSSNLNNSELPLKEDNSATELGRTKIYTNLERTSSQLQLNELTGKQLKEEKEDNDVTEPIRPILTTDKETLLKLLEN